MIFTKLTNSAFEKEEGFSANLNVENKQNIDEGSSQNNTSKTQLTSDSAGTDVDMTSLEDPVNNGYFCR